MKKLELFKFYSNKNKEGLNVFQVINKKIPYILWGIKRGCIGRYLLYEEELDKADFVEITKEEFLITIKKEMQSFQRTISLIEETSEQEYQEKREEYEKYLEEMNIPFEGTRVLLYPEKIREELDNDSCSLSSNIEDKEKIKTVFSELLKSKKEKEERIITLSNGQKLNLLFRQ